MAPTSSSTSESVTSSGVVTGDNPIHHSLLLLIVQIAVIISLSRLMAFLLRPLRQPRVVAEILGGILLGPTALGYIPGFTATIFPQSSVAVLETLADLGLIFFLFLVGLELDIHKISKMGSMALWVAAAGIILPFGFGAIVSSVIHKFLLVEPHVNFGAFTLFMGVALSITAFPVLARILTERKLLNTEVGQLAMSAAAFNDIVAWVLLALSVAITDTGSSPLVAVWVLLLGLAFLVFMFLLVQPVAYALAHYHQPIPEPVIAITLVLVLGAAFLTDAIGIHVIFGAFVCGLIIPKDGPFAGILIGKIEDYVSILFLPLYFASSGLKTHLSAINNWTAVLILAMVLATACLGKVMGTVIVAKVWGMERRKAVALGFLMNTKGLVELIVLNIGLSKGVINQELFAIMVIMAIVTTFMTTPIVTWLYSPARDMPPYLRRSIVDSGVKDQLRLLICTTASWNVQSMINFVEITRGKERKSLRPYVLHLMEYTERLSSIRMASFSRRETKKYWQEGNSELDTVEVAFRTYSEQNKVRVKTAIAISAFHDMHEDICNAAGTNRVNLILFPFPLQHVQPGFKNVFTKVLQDPPCSVGLLVDNGFAGTSTCINPSDNAMLHVCVLFFGGPDDREALLLARRMAQHNNVKVTVIQFVIQCLGQQSCMYSNGQRLSSKILLSHLQKRSVAMRGWDSSKRLACRVMAFFKAPWSARKQVAVITDSSHETHHHNSAHGQSEEKDKNTGEVYVSMDEVEFQHEKELDRQALAPILAATKSLNQGVSDHGHNNGNEIHEDSNIINTNDEVMELDSAGASNLTLSVCETMDPQKAVLDIANSQQYKLLLVGLHMHEQSPVVQSGAFVNSKVEQGLGALGDLLVSKDLKSTQRPSVLVIRRHSHLMISQEKPNTQPNSNKDSHQLPAAGAGDEIELNSSSSNSAPRRWSGESDVNVSFKIEGYAYSEDKDPRNISRDGMMSALHDLGGELSSP